MRLHRFALGVTVLAMLVPVAAVAIPGFFDTDPADPQPIARSVQAAPPQLSRALESPPLNPEFAIESSGVTSTSTAAENDSEPPTTPDDDTAVDTDGDDTDGSTTTTAPENGSTATSISDTTTTTQAAATTTTTAASHSPPSSDGGSHHHPPTVEGTITGTACPCTVEGVVELKGNVSLQGDIMVMGGTLVARPGVTVNGNGHQIMFMNGGKADFQGTKVFTWSGTGANANLQRDVVFSNMSRIMFHHGAGKSTLRYIRVTNSGVSEQLGFYPLHWHLNGNSTRGTLVEGVVIDKAANHAFVPHGSHGITFRDTIAKDVIREAYWWDPGGGPNPSNDTLFDHVLAVDVDYPRSLGNLGLHHRMSAFRLGLGANNTIRNSVARATKGGKDCSGFHWPEGEHAVWTFVNNATYASNCHGIFVWQNDSLPHVVNGFSGGVVSLGAYVNTYTLLNLNVDGVILHVQGRNGVSPVFDGGNLGDVEARRHNLLGAPVVFRNLTIGSFTIDNGGGEPGTYLLENTNLSCSDIIYESVASGTRVVINGSDC